jgi:hypothetical protein
MRATRLVTVLLPLVPVMPITGARTARANNSTSPKTSMPRARAWRAIGSSSDTPGDINSCEASVEQRQIESAQADVQRAASIRPAP